jgi:CelD/BcsL family acetyltransferase involved in cellulose biosynthesis
MLSAETYHPNELAEPDAAQWRVLQAAHADFANPLLGPDFARAVGKVRDDARVSVFRRDGRAVGFLAYHLRPGGFVRAIGAPFSDYHSLVAEPGLSAEEALAAAGVAAFRFTGLVDPHGAFEVASRVEAFAIALEGRAEDYLEALRAASPKRFKNYRRLDHKLDREVGELRIVAPDHDPAAFEQLIAWKRDQMTRTGVHDVLAADWTRRLMAELFETRDGPMRGLMINLYAGDRLVAGHFGVRAGGYYHPWIASTDPELAAWSPA